MLRDERRAASLVAGNPGLMIGAGLASVLVVGAYVLGWSLVGGRSLPRWTAVLLAIAAASVVRAVVLPFPLAGLYAGGRRARSNDGGASTLSVLRGAVGHYRRLLGATVRARLVALALFVPLFGLLLAGETAVTYARYAAGGDQIAIFLGNEEAVILVVLLAAALARFAVVFYDLPVLFGGVAASRGWRVGLQFARNRPRALLRYGVGRVLLWSPVVLAPMAGDRALEGMDTSTTELFPDVVVVLGLLWLVVLAAVAGVAMVAAYHVLTYERRVEPFLRERAHAGGTTAADSQLVDPVPGDGAEGDGTGRRRIVAVALAALLVVGATAGAAAVRIADVRPMPDEEVRPVDSSMDAATIVENAASTVDRTSHRYHQRIYEVDAATGERAPPMVVRFGVDRDDRQVRLTMVQSENGTVDRTDVASVYTSESTVATSLLGTGEWIVEPTSEYVRMQAHASLPWAVTSPEDADWQVLDRTDESVVVGFERQPSPDEDAVGRQLTGQRVRLHVDPETGRPTRMVERVTYETYADNGTVTDRQRWVYVTEFSAFGTADVERPAGAGDRGPLEWLADLVFY